MASRAALGLSWRALGNVASACVRKPSIGAPAVLNIRQSSTNSAHLNSTSALAYKARRRRQGPLPLPEQAPAWSAEAYVSNILYETPPATVAPPKRHILNCLVQNEPGVLSRVSGILAARGFNIDSLVVCSTQLEDLSRMTIVLSGQDSVVEQARRQLEDLVPVWAVLDYTNSPLVQRELLLAKVNLLGPQYFRELQAHHRELTAAEAEEEQSLQEASHDFTPSQNAVDEALRHKHAYLTSIRNLTTEFGGKVLDISTNSCIVELQVSLLIVKHTGD
jgi:acetolactate synthase I/III small subunit